MSINEPVQSQSDIIRKNISAISEVQCRERGTLPALEKGAGWITNFSGLMAFVYIHGLWFGLWILLSIALVHILDPPWMVYNL